MNNRQKLKTIKRRNKLLMDIINSNPDFLRIFDYYTKEPFKVNVSHVPLQTYAARFPLEPMLGNNATKFAEDNIIMEFELAIRKHVEWRVIRDDFGQMLEGRIMIAERR